MDYPRALHVLRLNHPPSASQIKSSFRQLCLEFHPDRNPGERAAENFHAVVTAYNFLVENPGFWESNPALKEELAAVHGNIEDIFDDIFGFTREDRILGYRPPEPISLTLTEVAYGTRKRAKLMAYVKCATCQGSGAKKGVSSKICKYCFGEGQIQARSPDRREIRKICPRCLGKGRETTNPCKTCQGFGNQPAKQMLEVYIPAGMMPGGIYTLHAQDVKTGSPLDLFVRIELKKDVVFQIEKYDLLCDYFLWEGEKQILEFPGLWGMLSLPIGQEVSEGSFLVVPGQGLPFEPEGKARGDLKIRLHPVNKRQALKAQKKHLEQVALNNPSYGKKETSFWSRVLGF